MKSEVIVRGPNTAETYNLIILTNGGVQGMSIGLEEAAELARQLVALLDREVKDQPAVLPKTGEQLYWDHECCRLTGGCDEVPGHDCCLVEIGRCAHGRRA